MNVNHVYIIIGVAAITALISTVINYALGSDNTAVVIGASAGSTIAVTIAMIRSIKKKND